MIDLTRTSTTDVKLAISCFRASNLLLLLILQPVLTVATTSSPGLCFPSTLVEFTQQQHRDTMRHTMAHHMARHERHQRSP